MIAPNGRDRASSSELRAALVEAHEAVDASRDVRAAIEAIAALAVAIRSRAPKSFRTTGPACVKAIEALSAEPPQWFDAGVQIDLIGALLRRELSGGGSRPAGD